MAIQNPVENQFHIQLNNPDPNEDYLFKAIGKSYALEPHTPETRAQARAASPAIAQLSDDQLTHYTASAVTLPANDVIRVQVTKTLRSEGLTNGETTPVLAAMYVHNSPVTQGNPDDPKPPHHIPHHHPVNYLTTAQTLAFHHPELMTKKAHIAAIVMDYMSQTGSPMIYNLLETMAGKMSEMGDPSTGTTGWAFLEQTKKKISDPTPGSAGHQATSTAKYYYLTQPRQPVLDLLQPAMVQLMIHTKNDLRLENTKWTLQHGTATVHQKSANDPLDSTGEIEVVTGNDSWNVLQSQSGSSSGITFDVSVTSHSARTVSVTANNSYLRYVDLYYQFLNNDGLVIDTNGKKVTSGDGLNHIGMIPPTNTFCAIPIPPKGSTSGTITFPENAVSATLYAFGPGLHPTNYTGHVGTPTIYTGLVNLAIPTIMIAFTVASTKFQGLYDAMKSPAIRGLMAGIVGEYFVIKSAADDKIDYGVLSSIGQVIFEQAAQQIMIWLTEKEVEGKAIDEIPFVGWAAAAISVAIDVADITETLVECALSPMAVKNQLSTVNTPQFNIYHDPEANGFPTAETGEDVKCRLKVMYYDPTKTRVIDVDTTPNADGCLTAQFTNHIGLGSMVKFEVDYHVGSFLAGKATSGWIANTNGETGKTFDLYLVQFPYPLTSSTTYSHNQIVQYNSDYEWATASAPTATRAAANSGNTGNNISEWLGLAYSPLHASLGYSWKSSNTGLLEADGQGLGIQLNAFANFNTPGSGLANTKYPDNGFGANVPLVYDGFPPKFEMNKAGTKFKLGPNNQPIPDPSADNLGNYYIEPVVAGAGSDGGFPGYHLRKVDLTNANNFNTGPGQLSHGVFAYPPDSITMHPSGHVVAISTQYRCIMVLKIDEAGTQDDQAPIARNHAGKALNIRGSEGREGLLFNPISICCSDEGTLFILDQLTSAEESFSRVQAFDPFGNPVISYFYSEDTSGTSSLLNLPATFEVGGDAKPITYLDISATGDEKLTYVFVLFYIGSGDNVDDYYIRVYEAGDSAATTEPLFTSGSIPACFIEVDMWHKLYTLNYAMVQNSSGATAGPVLVPFTDYVRTEPSVSQWMPSLPKHGS